MSEIAKVEREVQRFLMEVAKETSGRALQGRLRNAATYSKLSDQQRELCVSAVEKRIREVAPAIAKKIFGSKDIEAAAYLDDVLRDLSASGLFSGNNVGSKVKYGGDMISGVKYIERYISYKSNLGTNVALGWVQNTIEEAPVLHISVRKKSALTSGKAKMAQTEEAFFDVSEGFEAAKVFKEKLLEVRSENV